MPELILNLSIVGDRRGDFGAQRVSQLPAQAMNGDLHRTLRGPELLRDCRVATVVSVALLANEQPLELVECGRLPRLDEIGSNSRHRPLDHAERPLTFEDR